MAETADILRSTAEWVEAADNTIALLARETGRPYRKGGADICGLLHAVSAWLDQHPDVDGQLADLLVVA